MKARRQGTRIALTKKSSEQTNLWADDKRGDLGLEDMSSDCYWTGEVVIWGESRKVTECSTTAVTVAQLHEHPKNHGRAPSNEHSG